MKERQIVNAQEMRQLDRLTIQEQQITSYQLMEQVATAVFDYISTDGICDLDGLFVIVAGIGNNGGDALAVARKLYESGSMVQVIVVGNRSLQSKESKHALELIDDDGIPYNWVSDESDLQPVTRIIEEAATVIDGLFGIGLNRAIEGLFIDMIHAINHSYAITISIDIPSGIQADNGRVLGSAVQANHTLVIQNYKQGNLLNDALDYSGQMHLLDVGILQIVFPEEQIMLPKQYLHHKLPKRIHNSYKYHYGNIITIGGSKGMMGAPQLSALAALRCGSGLSHLLYHESTIQYIHQNYPDIMTNTYFGIEEIPGIIQKKSAVVFGPGLGKNNEINADVLAYLLSTKIPLVIDADGIYYLKPLLHKYNTRKNIVLTPHYKEMADFLGVPVEEVLQEPVLCAKNIAHTYNVIVVLKGTCTIITNNEQTYFSIHGNPGLATAGTGDVLSGIIGSLLGRGLIPLEASKLGVLIHSIAGQKANNELGEESMLASDVIRHISEVIRYAKS